MKNKINMELFANNRKIINNIKEKIEIIKNINNYKQLLMIDIDSRYNIKEIEELNYIEQCQENLLLIKKSLYEEQKKLMSDLSYINNILYSRNYELVIILQKLVMKSRMNNYIVYYMNVNYENISEDIIKYNNIDMSKISVNELNYYNDIFNNYRIEILKEFKLSNEIMTDIIEMRKEELINIHGEEEGNRLHNEEI